MTDQQIVEALIARDEEVTQQFFFGNCRPLFVHIINYVFYYKVDYDEFVNEFYTHLMENDAYRLRQFHGRSSIYQWLKTVGIRYFIAKRNRMIDMEPRNTHNCVEPSASSNVEQQTSAQIDIEQLLEQMPNKRYAYVIKRLVIDDAESAVVADELGTNVNNLYNIRKRALAALTEIALKEAEKYEKENGQ